jgi:hypothetical protein
MQQCVFSVPRGLRVFEDAIRSVKAKCAWLRTQGLQSRLDTATGNRDQLRPELDQRLEIIEELNIRL